jgi:hypothetical protein
MEEMMWWAQYLPGSTSRYNLRLANDHLIIATSRDAI